MARRQRINRIRQRNLKHPKHPQRHDDKNRNNRPDKPPIFELLPPTEMKRSPQRDNQHRQCRKHRNDTKTEHRPKQKTPPSIVLRHFKKSNRLQRDHRQNARHQIEQNTHSQRNRQSQENIGRPQLKRPPKKIHGRTKRRHHRRRIPRKNSLIKTGKQRLIHRRHHNARRNNFRRNLKRFIPRRRKTDPIIARLPGQFSRDRYLAGRSARLHPHRKINSHLAGIHALRTQRRKILHRRLRINRIQKIHIRIRIRRHFKLNVINPGIRPRRMRLRMQSRLDIHDNSHNRRLPHLQRRRIQLRRISSRHRRGGKRNYRHQNQ